MTAEPVPVTPRQYRIVCELVRDGADNGTIAARMRTTTRTVANQLHAVMAATGCPSRTSLAVEVLRGRLSLRPADRRKETRP